MTPDCLIPLMVTFIAGWVSLNAGSRTFDGILSAVAAIIALIGFIWFVAIAPWFITLGVMLSFMVLGQLYLKPRFKASSFYRNL